MEKDKSVLDHFVQDFVRVLEKHAKYIIVSGFVVIALGRSRGTEDIDIIMDKIPLSVFVALHNELVTVGFECLQSDNPNKIYTEYLNHNIAIRYARRGTFVPNMELKFIKDELDRYQITTRKKLPETGLDVYFSSVEMNIAFKEELLKSQKDIEDAKHLRIVYSDKLNEEEISKVKEKIRRLRL